MNRGTTGRAFVRRAPALATALVFVLASCAANDDGAAPTPSARPSSTGSIEILQPEAGATITGDSFVVRVAVTGAQVLEEASRDVQPDTGHVHLTLDGEVVTQLAGLEYRIDVAELGIEPGTHILQAEFAAADHFPFDPRVIDAVTFTLA